MRYPDTRVRSVADFLEELKPRQRLKQPIWYRGQEKTSWDLKPTIDRFGGVKSEAPLITRFKQNALALIQNRPIAGSLREEMTPDVEPPSNLDLH